MIGRWLQGMLRALRRHPRVGAGLALAYALIAALAWWSSAPPPAASLAAGARAERWSLPTPAPAATAAGTVLLARSPWPGGAGPADGNARRGGRGRRGGAAGGLANLPKVGDWSFVGVVQEGTEPARALFVDAAGTLHRVHAGDGLPEKTQLLEVEPDAILIRREDTRIVHRLYAPAAATAAASAAAPATAPAPRSVPEPATGTGGPRPPARER